MTHDNIAEGQALADDTEEYDFHCITCSDEALPATVISVDQDMMLAQVRIGDTSSEVDVSLVDAVSPGDMLLVHSGVALGLFGNTETVVHAPA